MNKNLEKTDNQNYSADSIKVLKGLDAVGYTLQYASNIKSFEEQYNDDAPWELDAIA